jgi:chemotaxis regulatin CheY-phosphate phosphatase CheZ
MAESRALSPLNEHDFGAIEAAVMETERGRWFLAQYAQRNRTADTNQLLAAIGKLESAVNGERSMQQIERVRFDLVEMAKTIALLKIEIAAAGADGTEASRFDEATEALDAIVRTTESATSSILEAAEQIQEAAWALREAGSDHKMCDTLDHRAADIYTACTFQDLTAQRTQKVVRTLRSLEGRINALVDAWQEGGPVAADPASRGDAENRGISALSQSDIDVVIVENGQPDLVDDVSFFSDPGLDLFEPQVEPRLSDLPIDQIEPSFLEDVLPVTASHAPNEKHQAENDLMFREALLPVTVAAVTPASRPILETVATPGLAEIDQLPISDKLKLFS